MKRKLGLKRKKISLNIYIYFIIGGLIIIDVLRNSLLQYSYRESTSILQIIAIILRFFLIYISCIYILKCGLKGRDLFVIFPYIILMIATILFQKKFTFFDLFYISIFLGKYLEYRTVTKIYLYSLGISVIIVIILFYKDFFPSYEVIREGTERNRVTLGFLHPNTLGHLIFYMGLLYIALRDHKIKYYDLAMIVLISLWLYIYPNSITSSMLLVLLVLGIIVIKLFFFLLKKEIVKFKLIKIMSIFLIPVLITGLYLIISKEIGINIISNISSTLISRIDLCEKGISLYGIHFLNLREIQFTGTAEKYFGSMQDYFVVDCLYVYIFLVFGIMPGLFYFVYYIRCVKKCFIENNSILWIILVILMIFSITEASIITFKSAFVFILPMCKYNNDS